MPNEDPSANTAEADNDQRPEVTNVEPEWPQLPQFELEVALATSPVPTRAVGDPRPKA